MLALWNGIGNLCLTVVIRDSTLTNNGGKTALTKDTANLVIATRADNEQGASAGSGAGFGVAYTQSGATIESITTIGTFATPTAGKCRFKEVDATNHPGLYEIQFANARWGVSGARYVTVTISGAAGATQENYIVQIPAVNLDDSTNSATPAVSTTLGSDTTAVKAKTDHLPSSDIVHTSGKLWVLDGSGNAVAAASAVATVNTTLNTVNVAASAIEAKTNGLPADPADASDIAASFSAVNSTLGTIAGYIDTEVAAIKAKTDNLPADPAGLAGLASAHGAGTWTTATGFAVAGDAMTLTSGERNSIAAAMLDLSNGVETGLTPRQCYRLLAAALAGKLSGAGTSTVTFRNAIADSKDRIVAAVDTSGNRLTITVDLS